jgi:hypothetical protein
MLLVPGTGTQRNNITIDRHHLTQTLENIWRACFPDVIRANLVEIAYGHPWKRRLGLIRLSLDTTRTFIGVNALLQQPEAPDYVLLTTIAHELVHYAHGFGSPLPRLFAHPHANSVVERELEQRGLGEIAQKCDEWIDNAWFAFYDMQRMAGTIRSPGRKNLDTD